MKHFLNALTLTLLFILPDAQAQSPLPSTNLKDGGFQIRFEDAPLRALQLRYSSRMNSRSIFGTGWCSDLDARIQVLRGGDLELTECDEVSRFQAVKSSSLTRVVPLLFEDQSSNVIELGETGYWLERGDESLYFDASGQLQKRQLGNDLELKILSRTEKLWILQIRGQLLQLEMARGNRPSKIRGSQDKSWSLIFENSHLAQLGNLNFQYDLWDNLVLLKNEKQQLHLEYDSEDRIVRLETSQGCRENFEYPPLQSLQSSLNIGSMLRATARAWRNCGSGPELTAEVTSEYQRVSENNVILTAAEIRESKSTRTPPSKRRLEFHPILGPLQTEPPLSPEHRELVIAVIDTGADLNLPLLKKYLWTNLSEKPNLRDDDGNGFKDDLHGWNFAENSADLRDHHGHGTHIASLIASQLEELSLGNHARPVRLMILKYYRPEADGPTNLKNSLRAFRYALQKGADIINYSGGGRVPSAEEEELLRQATQQKVLVVAAAGNESLNSDRNPFFPANYPFSNILSVGSMGKNQLPVRSSNFGERGVDLMAIGEAVEALLPGGRRGRMTGTSQATAMVTAAAAAYMRQASGRLNPEDVISSLLLTSESLPGLKDKNRMGGTLAAMKLVRSRSSQEIAQGPRQIGRNEKSEALFLLAQAWPGSKSSSYLSRSGLK